MADSLAQKIADYVHYASTAISLFESENYADSSSNTRKAAEAACKVLVLHAFNENLARKKMEGKGLKDLIYVIIRENICDRRAINHIEALQIVGNKAAHDNVISKTESEYALTALNLLTDYLFNDKLKIARQGFL